MDINDPGLQQRIAASKARRENGGAASPIRELAEALSQRNVRAQVDAEMRRFRRHQLAASAIAVVMLYAFYRWQERHV